MTSDAGSLPPGGGADTVAAVTKGFGRPSPTHALRRCANKTFSALRSTAWSLSSWRRVNPYSAAPTSWKWIVSPTTTRATYSSSAVDDGRARFARAALTSTEESVAGGHDGVGRADADKLKSSVADHRRDRARERRRRPVVVGARRAGVGAV